MKPITLLITGSGGLGQEILKATKRVPLAKRIICVDAEPESPGLYRGDTAYLVPKATSSKYIPDLLKVCQIEKVHIILVGTQQELIPLSKHKQLFADQGTKVIIADHPAMKIAVDKYLSMHHLSHQGIVAPETVLVSDKQGVKYLLAKYGFPLFTKARNQSGSRDAQVINTATDLKRLPQNNVLQQYLGEGNEFTAGCYLSQNNQFQFILMKRQLFRGTGLSGQVMPVKFARVKNYCRQIASSLSIYGPYNIQLKIIRGQPILFEINPRFSSTTSIQAGLGMNFVHLAVAEALSLPLPQLSFKLQLVLRYFNEIYLFPRQVKALTRHQKLNRPTSQIENNF